MELSDDYVWRVAKFISTPYYLMLRYIAKEEYFQLAIFTTNIGDRSRGIIEISNEGRSVSYEATVLHINQITESVADLSKHCFVLNIESAKSFMRSRIINQNFGIIVEFVRLDIVATVTNTRCTK